MTTLSPISQSVLLLLAVMVALPRLAHALYLVRHGNASKEDLQRLHGGLWATFGLLLLALLLVLAPFFIRALQEATPGHFPVVPPPRLESAGKTCNPACPKGQTCCNGTCCSAANTVAPVSASLLEWTGETLLLDN